MSKKEVSLQQRLSDSNLSLFASSSPEDEFDPVEYEAYLEKQERDSEPLRKDIRNILRKLKRFYYAYDERSMGTMKKIWSDSDSVKVIIPDTGVLNGYDAVMGNMQKIFFPPPGEEEISNKAIFPSDINLQLRGTTAWVTSIEEVRGKINGPLGPMPTNFPKMRVTTLMRKQKGEWKIIMRQVSQLSPIQVKNQDESTRRREAGSIVIEAEEGIQLDETAVGSIVSSLKERLNKSKSSPAPSPSPAPVAQNTVKSVQEDSPKQMMRRTVEALRRLCEENRISVEQKRVLLSDVIRHATKENASMVEIAYSLLMDGISDSETYEEFADQCRVFADQLLEAKEAPRARS
eukprot:CAMPEP_0117772222 /NCGR_PEP_ID=MMETSP0947-20121206/24941_1 /TAXON_ID=44440 /ORGANISM="Chattonella subsalsa, Strain CCMP2191" /LENGTH=346 /DNA_ID=CAMNT_0005597751 /DNA_START=293 /DNA_END=1333 /DNA_ORIENTATION=-